MFFTIYIVVSSVLNKTLFFFNSKLSNDSQSTQIKSFEQVFFLSLLVTGRREYLEYNILKIKFSKPIFTLIYRQQK